MQPHRARRARRGSRARSLALALGLWSCGDAGAPSGSGVLLVAVDGLRADHVGAMGYDRETTPGLDELASEGWLFTQTFAAAPLARPSLVGLLTGCDPRLARRDDTTPRTWRVPIGMPLLAVELLSAGYRTAAFLDEGDRRGPEGSVPPRPEGLTRGFQKVDEASDAARRTPIQVERVLSWLRTLELTDPWFACLHLADLERSWSQPEKPFEEHFRPRPELQHVPPVGNTDAVFFAVPYSRWRGGSRTVGRYEASYDGHLRQLDRELAHLFAGLRRLGRDAHTTICVVGTHGVQFGEQGLYLRSGLFSTADLQVPWILRPRSGLTEAAREVTAVASLIDVAPTLLALEGIAVPVTIQGVARDPGTGGASTATLAFASSGLLPGSATFSERLVFESLDPGSIEDEPLRRAWFGADPPPDSTPQERFYDRLVDPWPPLHAGGSDGHAQPERERLRAATEQWRAEVERRRAQLQAATEVARASTGASRR